MKPPSPHHRLAFWTLALVIGLGSWYQVVRLRVIHERIGGLEDINVDETTLRRALRNELESVHNELVTLRTGIASASAEAERARILAERVNSTERRLGDLGLVMEAQASSLTQLEEAQASFGPEILERELNERDQRLLRRWEALSELVSSTQMAATESRAKIEELESGSHRDLPAMWRELVGPVVQLAGDTSVGSGVLLASRTDPDDPGRWVTYMITAWHVVRDIQGDLSRQDEVVPVTIYDEDGTLRHEEAHLLCFNADLDAALLRLYTSEPMEHGATLADRERLERVRIFDEVYAVGCPLGNDPIPTHGEIATSRHAVDGENYWMINAPTYIGNSGGGIFDSDTYELLGIFSKIYTHGSLRPTIVPHMGLVTPLDAIYGWLEGEDYGFVEHWGRDAELASEKAPTGNLAAASAKR